jgi:hypothetical protein
MYESVPQKVLDELEKPLKLANCRLLKVKRMPQMDEATGSLLSHLAP